MHAPPARRGAMAQCKGGSVSRHGSPASPGAEDKNEKSLRTRSPEDKWDVIDGCVMRLSGGQMAEKVRRIRRACPDDAAHGLRRGIGYRVIPIRTGAHVIDHYVPGIEGQGAIIWVKVADHHGIIRESAVDHPADVRHQVIRLLSVIVQYAELGIDGGEAADTTPDQHHSHRAAAGHGGAAAHISPARMG